MARVQLEAGEIDHRFRVKQAIAKRLLEGQTAEISKESIAKYEEEDLDRENSPLAALDHIVAGLPEFGFDIPVEYSEHGDDDYQFRPRPR
jgi:hypothetical protein